MKDETKERDYLDSQLFKSNVPYEKYRPRTIDDIILPNYIKDKIRAYLSDKGKSMPHLGLFSRLPGTGKSSLAKVILSETQAEGLWINASLDKGIDVLRSRIQQFASQQSLNNNVKIVVLDEFDHFSPDGQAAFRGFIDQFGDYVRFIFTGNLKERVIEPLLDRMEIYDFNQFSASDIAVPIMQRLEFILQAENVAYDREDVKKVIKANFPKIRKMIGDISMGISYGPDGSKTFDYSFVGSHDKLDKVLILMQQRDVQKVKLACYSIGNIDYIFSYLSDKIEILFKDKPDQIVNAIIAIAKYQSYAGLAKDKQLNAVACCFELMKLL